ncbi:acetoacetate--CoA ligase [Luminiphilus sp.]|nr:acetoacetate--CoA ligase [Luminiphilus sp.]
MARPQETAKADQADLLWTPSESRLTQSRLQDFMGYLETQGQGSYEDYGALHQFSVVKRENFWSALWDYTDIVAEQKGAVVAENSDTFPCQPDAGVRWFPEARLNFAENLLRYRDDRPALISRLENGQRRVVTYEQLHTHVAGLAASLRALGVGPGDRVAGFMPNVIETVEAMLATTSLGAIWSSCSPDFGINGVLDRFGQIQPKVLFAADGYFYNGKVCDSLERLAAISDAIDTLEQVVVIPVVSDQPDCSGLSKAVLWEDFLDSSAAEINFAQLPFDHPLFIMYSSGTTGMPKCIVHGAGGTLIQHLKEHQLHVDLSREDVMFYFTTCGWMMWNWLVSGLASGAALVLYDGSPFAQDGLSLLKAIEAEKISIFGVGAKYLAALEKAGIVPQDEVDLASLKTILSTGSPLSHESFRYVYKEFKADICLSSISGGTDILSCFVGGSPILPVHVGEIQAPGLGMAVEIWSDVGEPLLEGKGELVCTKPFPSMPIGFWNDTDGELYRQAYFNHWANVWAHGDYGEVTPSKGYIIHGRSDAVLNPGGVRIGTAEIYRQVERLEEVQESIVVGQEWDNDVRVVLFVVLTSGTVLSDNLRARIANAIRENTTPRHVPAKILEVPDIPRTLSGKIVELAVRNAIHGQPIKNTDALANPEALEAFKGRQELRT